MSHWIPILLPLLLGFTFFSATGRDDSYITYWAAHTLAHYGSILNYNGDYVEQGSSLAHVVLLAALTRLTGLSVPTLGVLTSAASGCVAVWLTGRLAAQLDPSLSSRARWLTASWAGLVYWSFGGLEATLAASSYAWLALVYARALRGGLAFANGLQSVAATGLCLTVRPEAIFLVGAVLGGLAALIRLQWRNEARQRAEMLRVWQLAAVAVTVTVVMLVWRRWYFDDWFPQPVTAKVAGLSARRLYLGLRYLWTEGGGRIDGAVWLVGGSASVWQVWRACRGAMSPVATIAALFTLAGLTLAVAAGGDWMEGGRFLVPLLPTTVVVMLASCHRWLRHRVVFRTAVALQLAGTLLLASQASTGSPAWASARSVEFAGASWFEMRQRVNYRDVVFSRRLLDVVSELHAASKGDVSVMSVQMGLASYRLALAEFGHVKLIDMFGLATKHFTTCPLTASLPRSSLGLQVYYDFFFAHREALYRECGIRDPDVIFDLDKKDWPRARLVAASGYRIVYQQEGAIANGSRWFPGRPVDAEAFIAVRQDLNVPATHPAVRFSR